MQELIDKLDRAASIISRLVDIQKTSPDYHGSGLIDEAVTYLEEDAREQAA